MCDDVVVVICFSGVYGELDSLVGGWSGLWQKKRKNTGPLLT